VGRADANHAHVRRKPVDDQPFVVDPNGYRPRTGGGEGNSHRRIAGVFDGDDGFAGCDQCSGQQIERLLRSGRD
jgi:hypothetical protein